MAKTDLQQNKFIVKFLTELEISLSTKLINNLNSTNLKEESVKNVFCQNYECFVGVLTRNICE